MRLRTSALALVFLAAFAHCVRAAEPLAIWPPLVAPLDKGALAIQLDALDSALKNIESMNTNILDPLIPAVRFQKVFLQAISGVAPAVWRAQVEEFAKSHGDGPVATGLREVSRAWLARLQMNEIDVVLRKYYRRNVRFPASLAECENDIPASLRKDPWGGSWIYKPRAPQGFKRLATQRYQLGPEKLPNLGPLAGAVGNRISPAQAWVITPRDAGGKKALEFRSPRAGSSSAIIQAGGKVEDCTLLYIGDKWALMAGVDQLFAVSF
jgi:hypothetical protein